MDSVAHPFLSAGYLVLGLRHGRHLSAAARSRLAEPPGDRIAQSLSSWTVWAACRVVALLYGCLVIGDPLFILAVGLDLLGRLAVLAVLMRAMWRLQAWPPQRRALARLEGMS